MTATQGIVTSVGYTLAIASLSAMIVAPAGYALADDAGSSSADAASITSNQSNAPVASEKNETVNVSTYADGSVKNVKVSTTLKTDGSTDVADVTSLGDLKADDENVSFSQEGELVWHSPSGKDIVYSGTTNAALPIEIKVTYRYNGSYITPQELRGKSGHVVIRYDYINNSQTTADGIQVYTPFAAMTGLMLDNDVFSNVKVTNGRLIEDGDRTIALGYAMPGLASSLDAGDDFEVPDYFEVEADAVDFELGSSLTMVSPDLLDGFDASDFNTGEYADASSGLKSAMAELTKGSNELTDGLKELAEGAKQLSNGTLKLDEGLSTTTNEIPALTNGIAQLHSGSTDLAAGIGGYAGGLAGVKTKVVQAQKGASDLADTLSGDQLKQLAGVLSDAATELEGDGQLLGYVTDQAKTVRDDATAVAGSYQSLKRSAEGLGLSEEDQAKVNALFNNSSLEANVSQLGADAGALAGYTGQISTQATQAAAGALSQADLSQLATGAQSLADALGAIADQGFGTAGDSESLIGAATKLKAGADQLENGLAILESKSGELTTGLSELASGVSQISQGASQLSAATQQAADGSGSMAEGLQKFNDEGVSKIADAIDNRIVKLGNRFTAVTDAGGSYKNFAGITDGTTGSVKFVFETEAIKND
ncbi:MAG: hypothetical protein IJF97_05260 [Eggerthellaceae bacterium]|nr:hypothetical protein [Eggerthellaceae bacterium]